MFGYAEVGGNHADTIVERRYAASLAPPDSCTESGDDCFGWSWQTASANGITVFLEGRPHWPSQRADATPAAALIDAYLLEGREFLANINGSFALALFDRRTRELTLAIDRMGIASLAWTANAQRVAFSNSAVKLAHRPDSDSKIRSQAIYDYFFFHMIPSPESVFSGIRKLGPGSAVVFTQKGHREYRYWTPDFSRARRTTFEELSAGLHEALKSAVQTNLSPPSTGAFLSGGLDSSTVSGYLAAASATPADTFSIGFGVQRFDELEYARITNRHFGCNAHEYTVTPDDILRAIPIVASTFDEPFGNSSAVPTYACAKYAKDLGMSRLLAGDGGDEIFAGNERYATQQVFELFGRVPSMLRNPFKALVQATISPQLPVTVLRKMRSYVDQASIPLPQRYESWNFVHREGVSTMFHQDFMASIDVDHPIHHMQEVFQSAPSTDLLDRMLYYDWKFTLADNDLRKVTKMCAAAEIDVAFPMLDNRVVELSARVPSSLKMKRLELRTFFKRAMSGFLPEQVLKKQKHGFGLPFGEWLKTDTRLAESVYASLSDLKKRSIIEPSFIDRLTEQHRQGNAWYYGLVIWDLVILEEWLKCQAISS